MFRSDRDLENLRRLMPTENGLTVFDAETQETSYGTWFFDGLPFIFDTHRKDAYNVATMELLTEVLDPIQIGNRRLERFCAASHSLSLLPIPYTGCFFKANLHVYSFSGPVRGFDIAASGRSVAKAEQTLKDSVRRLWPEVPPELTRAQRELVARKRKVRHPEDLDVLLEKWTEAKSRRAK